MTPELSTKHLQTLEEVAANGETATREALGPLVTTAAFIELVNLGLLVNELDGARVKDEPDTRSNVWRLTEAGRGALDSIALTQVA